MPSILNTFMFLLNYASGQQVNGTEYFNRLNQLNAKVEVIFPAKNLVEEFHVTYDRQLKLARYEYSLDVKIPPYFTLNAVKSICDYNTGVVYDIDQTTGSCVIDVMDIKVDNDTSTHSLLRMLAPEQLFAVNKMMKFLRKDSTRGMKTDVWTVDIDNFFVAGYGLCNTRHTLYTLSANVTKYYNGSTRPAVLLQRSIQLLDQQNVTPEPLVILNYFDFFTPKTPLIYDFNVMACLGTSKQENKEEILIQFSGQLDVSYNRPDDPTVASFRREALQELSKLAGISPLRSLGNFWSQDQSDTFFTTVLLPRPDPMDFFQQVQKGVSVQFSGLGKNEKSAAPVQLQTCAERCSTNEDCSQFAWCQGSADAKMFTCILQSDTNSIILDASVVDVVSGCDLYKEKQRKRKQQPDVIQALDNLGKAIENRQLRISIGTKTLTAIGLRKNVSLLASTKGEKSADTFLLYKTFTTLRSTAIKETAERLTSKQCVERCASENSFVCHSVSTCGYGDCSLSDQHGDELLREGSKNLASHSHCAIWTRIWTSEFILLSSTAFPKMEVDKVVEFAENEQTCAKQCSFPAESGTDCESFVWCPKSESKLSTCTLYKHHVFDQTPETTSENKALNGSTVSNACRHYTRDHRIDFKELRGIALADNPDVEFLEIEVEPEFESWRCAKNCLDKLGDDRCYSTELCYLGGKEQGSVHCRVSSAFVPTGSRTLNNVTVPNQHCTVYSRIRHADDTVITGRSANTVKVYKVGKRADPPQIPLLAGHSSGEMVALGLSMLMVGAIIVVGMVAASRKLLAQQSFVFSRFV